MSDSQAAFLLELICIQLAVHRIYICIPWQQPPELVVAKQPTSGCGLRLWPSAGTHHVRKS